MIGDDDLDWMRRSRPQPADRGAHLPATSAPLASVSDRALFKPSTTISSSACIGSTFCAMNSRITSERREHTPRDVEERNVVITGNDELRLRQGVQECARRRRLKPSCTLRQIAPKRRRDPRRERRDRVSHGSTTRGSQRPETDVGEMDEIVPHGVTLPEQ